MNVIANNIILSFKIELKDPIKYDTFTLKIECTAFDITLLLTNNVPLASVWKPSESNVGECYYSIEAVSSTEYMCNITFDYTKCTDKTEGKLTCEQFITSFEKGLYDEDIEMSVHADVVKRVERAEEVGITTNKDSVMTLGKNPLFHNMNGVKSKKESIGVTDKSLNNDKLRFFNRISFETVDSARTIRAIASEPLDKEIVVKISHRRLFQDVIVVKSTIPAGKTQGNSFENTGLLSRAIMGIYEKVSDNELSQINFTNKYYFDKKDKYWAEYRIKPQAELLANRMINAYAKGRQSAKLSLAIETISDIYKVGEAVYIMNCRRVDYDSAMSAIEAIEETKRSAERAKFIDKTSYMRDIHGQAKKFIITSAELTYNGAYRQSLDLLEV